MGVRSFYSICVRMYVLTQDGCGMPFSRFRNGLFSDIHKTLQQASVLPFTRSRSPFAACEYIKTKTNCVPTPHFGQKYNTVVCNNLAIIGNEKVKEVNLQLIRQLKVRNTRKLIRCGVVLSLFHSISICYINRPLLTQSIQTSFKFYRKISVFYIQLHLRKSDGEV